MSAVSGDHQAFAGLVSNHQTRIYGLAVHLLRNQQDAADAAQEIFIRCFNSLHSFDVSQSFGAWLYRIAYNHCLDVLRLRQRRPIALDGRTRQGDLAPEVVDPGPGVEELVERMEVVQSVRQAMSQISSEHHHILALRYTLDLSYAEISQVLEIPESTVTMRIHHAKRAIRGVLQEAGEDRHVSS